MKETYTQFINRMKSQCPTVEIREIHQYVKLAGMPVQPLGDLRIDTQFITGTFSMPIFHTHEEMDRMIEASKSKNELITSVFGNLYFDQMKILKFEFELIESNIAEILKYIDRMVPQTTKDYINIAQNIGDSYEPFLTNEHKALRDLLAWYQTKKYYYYTTMKGYTTFVRNYATAYQDAHMSKIRQIDTASETAKELEMIFKHTRDVMDSVSPYVYKLIKRYNAIPNTVRFKANLKMKIIKKISMLIPSDQRRIITYSIINKYFFHHKTFL